MQIRANANDNQVISVSNAVRERASQREGGKARKNTHKTSIFAGDLGMQNDMITQRKQRAQKKALKIIGDAWNGDRKVDQSIIDIKDKLSMLQDEKRENLNIIAEGDEQKEALRQQYGIKEDSQEQKDLELLEKKADAYRNPMDVHLTEEEQERLAELEDQPRTEYQQRCLNIDDYQRTYEIRNDQIDAQIQGYNATVRAIKIERLKYHEMVDAQKDADEVMQAANKEIWGMLIDEGKEHVDEELEEEIEEAKEKAEEKAEEEEKVEERKEDQAELEERIDEAHEKNEELEELRKDAEERSREDADLLGEMIDAGMGGIGTTSDVQSDIKNMLHKMKLLEEDLKGSMVDDQL
ncbi:MAG: hypothetical protein K2J99_01280 [Lachnospiraceae bacterium]|nr:hypothetical protein [Lachnospiraceae bacterium]